MCTLHHSVFVFIKFGPFLLVRKFFHLKKCVRNFFHRNIKKVSEIFPAQVFPPNCFPPKFLGVNVYLYPITTSKWLILGLKAEKQLRNKNHTENWALGCSYLISVLLLYEDSISHLLMLTLGIRMGVFRIYMT